MRVGYLGIILHGRYSGVERCVAQLGRALIEYDRRNEYVLYAPRNLGPEEARFWRQPPRADDASPAPARRLRLMPFAGHQRLARFAWEHTVLPGVLRREGIDLLHAPAYTAPKVSIPTVVTVYDVIALTHPQFCRLSNRIHFRWALPASVRAAARVIVPTQASRRELCRTLGTNEEKVRVVRPGIPRMFRPITDEGALAEVRERFRLRAHVILFVGNLEPKKDVPTLLRAFARLKRHGLPHQLVLVSAKTWLARDVHRVIEAHPFRRDIRSLGYMPGQYLPALYSLAEVFVFPSIVEGFGVPPLEAMACGTPVVISDAPALVENAGRAALSAPVGDDEAFAEAIERLAGDETLRADLSARGLSRAAEFTWERAVKATVAVYREALDG